MTDFERAELMLDHTIAMVRKRTSGQRCNGILNAGKMCLGGGTVPQPGDGGARLHYCYKATGRLMMELHRDGFVLEVSKP